MKKRMVLFLLLIMTSIVLCGCGDDKEQTDNPKDNISSGTPVAGGSVVVGITQDMDSLDPHKAVAAGTDEVLFNMFEGLVKPDKDGNLIPAVASDYEIAPDGKQYTFTLRDGVKFHNGQLVTADDVIYSLKRCAGLLETSEPEVVLEAALSIITDISKTDEKTIVLTLSESNTELAGYLTCAIIPKDYKEQATKPVGTGPFRFVSYTPLENLVMEKNPDYYGTPAYLDKVTFRICSSIDAAFMELLGGTIDIFPYLTEEQAAQLNKDYRIEVGASNLVQALFLNNEIELFRNPLVRQALCHAVNAQEMLDMVAGGRGTVIGTNMFPNFGKYYNEALVGTYEYDVEKAKSLLAEAGYPNGISFTITVPSNYDFHVATAQVLVWQLEKAGIEAKIQLVEWQTWLTDIYRGRKYEATIIGLDADLAPSDVLQRYVSDASTNFVNYNNEQFDVLFAKALAETDDAEKVKMYKELQEILTLDAASVYLADLPKLVAVNAKLGGYVFYPVYVMDMSTVYYME